MIKGIMKRMFSKPPRQKKKKKNSHYFYYEKPENNKIPKNVTVKEIKSHLNNSPPPSHAYGFSQIRSRYNYLSYDYIFFGGCSWEELTRATNDFNFMYKFDPIMKEFQTIHKNKKQDDNNYIISSRYRHSMILRDGDGENSLIIFAGVKNNYFFCNELYEYNISKGEWKEIKYNINDQNAPPNMGFHTALYQKMNDLMITFGGKNDTVNRMKGIYIYNFGTKKWKKIKIDESSWPCERGGHSMDYVNDSQIEFCIFGGINNDSLDLNDCWKFSMDEMEWTKLNCIGDIPRPRASHSSVILRNKLFIFGGAAGASESFFEFALFNDLYVLNLNNLTWNKIELSGDIPNPVYIHKSGIFVENGCIKMFVFGGIENLSSCNRLFELTLYSDYKNYVETFRNGMLDIKCKRFYDCCIRTEL